jgi:hypothetical protein
VQNHEVWAAGEPAFLKYWLQDPAASRGSMALDQEEGFSQVGWAGLKLAQSARKCCVIALSACAYRCMQVPVLVSCCLCRCDSGQEAGGLEQVQGRCCVLALY